MSGYGYVAISVQYQTRELLKELKEYDGESYNSVIKRLAEGKAKPKEAPKVDNCETKDEELEDTWTDEKTGEVWNTKTSELISGKKLTAEEEIEKYRKEMTEAEAKDGPIVPVS